MNEERMQILNMVKEGKLSPEEAANLIEAVEPNPGTTGPKPTHLRIRVMEGSKTRNFSVGIGLVEWALGLVPNVVFRGESIKLDSAMLERAIRTGAVGRIFEAEEDGQKIEIWLDA